MDPRRGNDWFQRLLPEYSLCGLANSQQIPQGCNCVHWDHGVSPTLMYILSVRNTGRFVLYFIMRKYTSVSYIGGLSVQYK